MREEKRWLTRMATTIEDGFVEEKILSSIRENDVRKE